MKLMHPVTRLFCVFAAAAASASAAVHVWEKQELTFTSARSFANPYTDVTVWVDLTGPNFKKRVYGFWDGSQTFRVRVLATEPGTWAWRSGSNPSDPGPCREERLVHGRSVGRRGEAAEPAPKGISPPHR